MKTSGPCNMETVLLHLTATLFDKGVKCACVLCRILRASVWAALCLCVGESDGKREKECKKLMEL